MTEVDSQYAALLQAVMEHGTTLKTRNSVVKRLTGWTMEFTETPLVGLRKTAWRNALREWEWFSSGSSKIDDLHESVRHWWRPWANENGEVRNNYSEQFRTACGGVVSGSDIHLEVVDQLAKFVEGIRDHPYSRNVLTTLNAAEMLHPSTPITNCHNTITQAFVEEGQLSLVTYQRSADLVCGLPHNLIQMAAFHLWLAASTGNRIGQLKWIGGNCHVYEQHYDLAEKMVQHLSWCKPTPILRHYSGAPNGEFRAKDFDLEGDYEPVLTDRAVMVV